MEHLLDDEKIAESKADVDNEELNAALNLAYNFTKKEICSLRVKDVFDGSDILPSIQLDVNKPPRSTEDSLKTILTSYIKHLEQTPPIDQDAPLFPKYFGSKGEKKFQRHISDFSIYRDFNAVKKDLRDKQYQQDQEVDSDSLVKKIAQSTGKSIRTINRSVGKAPRRSGSTRRKGKKLKDDDPLLLLQIMDDIVVLPIIHALDEDGVFKAINKNFSVIETLFEGPAINQMKYWLIEIIDNRVGEIENELLEIRNRTPKPVEKSETLLSQLRQFAKEIIAKHNKTPKSNQILDDEQKAAIPKQKKYSSNIYQTAGKNLKIPIQVVSDQRMTDKVNGLFSRINRVRSMISTDEWECLKKQQELIGLDKLKVSPNKNYLKKKLQGQRLRSPRITYPSDTQEDIQRKRIKYARQQIIGNTPDHSVVINYAVDLIKHTGLFCHEVTGLCLKNVIKDEYQKSLITEATQLDWIVDEIEPLPVKYPQGCNALSIRLSNRAKEVVRAEIEFLRGIDGTYFSFNIRSPLFPLTLSPPSFSRRKPNKEEKSEMPKTSPQQSKINVFKRALKKNHVSGRYENLRKQGILLYCAELIEKGLPKEDTAHLVQRFARYLNINAAYRIIKEVLA